MSDEQSVSVKLAVIKTCRHDRVYLLFVGRIYAKKQSALEAICALDDNLTHDIGAKFEIRKLLLQLANVALVDVAAYGGEDRDRVVHREKFALKLLVKAVHNRHRDDEHHESDAHTQKRQKRRKHDKWLGFIKP